MTSLRTAPQTVRLTVHGIPAPQGSKRAFRNPHSGRIQQVESSKRVEPWRQDIRQAVTDQAGGVTFEGPLHVAVTFWLPRPKGHYGTGRNADRLKLSAQSHPAGRPDVDKLARAVLDAVGSAGLWSDDAQVVYLTAWKRYADNGQRSGASILVQEVRNV